jgi:addiction module HigA family antidote
MADFTDVDPGSFDVGTKMRMVFRVREDGSARGFRRVKPGEQAMGIRREDLDKIDFSDVRPGRRLPAVHPGAILREEFLTPLGISVYELAIAIKVPRLRVNDIVLGRRAVSTDTALRLARYFGTSPEFWINLQAQYDLDVANGTVRRKIEREVAPRAA